MGLAAGISSLFIFLEAGGSQWHRAYLWRVPCLRMGRLDGKKTRTEWVLSENAFHEKAGRSQVGGSYLLGKIFSLPSRPCRQPSIRTLLMSDCSLGASWVFSFQPVLPPVYRPCLPSPRRKLGQAINAVTGTRRLSFVFLFSSMFLITLLPASSPGCCSATAHTLLRLPTADAATRPAFAPWQ